MLGVKVKVSYNMHSYDIQTTEKYNSRGVNNNKVILCYSSHCNLASAFVLSKTQTCQLAVEWIALHRVLIGLLSSTVLNDAVCKP